jgi:hypothetical protein
MPSTQVRRLPTLAAALVALLAAVLVAAAVAQAASGPSLLAPRQGKHLHRNTRPTFKVRDRSAKARQYGVTIVINNKRKVKHGELQEPGSHGSGTFAGMKRRKHGIWTYRPPGYTFPSWFMVRRGTYYWQAFHIDCGTNTPRSCHIVSKIHKFHVG